MNNTENSKSYVTPIVIGIIVLALVVIAFIRFMPKSGEPVNARAPEGVTALAQCLANKGVTMYGAAWCPHCQDQKKLFGEAFKKITYVECPDNPQMCLDQKIESYPTWVFPDGARVSGMQEFATLAQMSQCTLDGSATSTPATTTIPSVE